MTVLVNLLVILGMLVVLPIGLRLLGYPQWTVVTWWAAGGPAAVALWLPRGAGAAALAAPYALATLGLAGHVTVVKPDPGRSAPSEGSQTPEPTGHGVRFRLRAGAATTVLVIGSWNDWATGHAFKYPYALFDLVALVDDELASAADARMRALVQGRIESPNTPRQPQLCS